MSPELQYQQICSSQSSSFVRTCSMSHATKVVKQKGNYWGIRLLKVQHRLTCDNWISANQAYIKGGRIAHA